MDECPLCGEEMNMQMIFVSKDYAMYFDMECEHCGATLEVEVETIPHFNIKMKEVSAG